MTLNTIICSPGWHDRRNLRPEYRLCVPYPDGAPAQSPQEIAVKADRLSISLSSFDGGEASIDAIASGDLARMPAFARIVWLCFSATG